MATAVENSYNIYTGSLNTSVVQGQQYDVNYELGNKEQRLGVNFYGNNYSLSNSLSINDGSGKIGSTYTTNLSRYSINNDKIHSENNNLRHHQNKAQVLNFIGQDAIITNVENGGQEEYVESKDFNAEASISYGGGKVGGLLYTNVTSRKGDVLDNSGWRAGIGGSALTSNSGAVRGAAELVYQANWGATTSRANYGIEFGARFNHTGPELVASVKLLTSEGKQYTIPVGSFISNLAYGNFVGAAYNIVEALSPQSLPIPRTEAIMPDSEPRIRTHLPMFKEGLVELNEHGFKMLGDIIQNYRQNNGMTIELGKYFDEKGFFGRISQSLWGRSNAEELSQKRAEFLKQELVKMGIPEDRINIGTSKVEENENTLTVEDNYTNVRYKSNNNIVLNNGARFNAERSSPAGELKFEQLKENPIYKNLVAGKSDIEKEIIANILFDKTILQNPPLTIEKVAQQIKEEFYDKNIELSKALFNLSNDDAISNIQANQTFKEFIEKHNIDEKEAKLLANEVLNRNDKENKPLEESLNEYVNLFMTRGLTLSNLERTKNEYINKLKENPIYMEMVKDLSSDEKTLLQDNMFANYIANPQFKDFETHINPALSTIKQNVYDKGLSYGQLVYESTGLKNEYYENTISNIEKDFRNNKEIQDFISSNEFKELASRMNTSVSDERKEMIQMIKDVLLNNPNKTVQEAFDNIKDNIYDKGMTIGEYKYKQAQLVVYSQLYYGPEQQNPGDSKTPLAKLKRELGIEKASKKQMEIGNTQKEAQTEAMSAPLFSIGDIKQQTNEDANEGTEHNVKNENGVIVHSL